ncbi:hypothetical protein DFH06DRAFT_1182974 [Mycena polygramma]|nr:hypothetical protein DFH06DRAFT_1182974 [Mycena polygramma]
MLVSVSVGRALALDLTLALSWDVVPPWTVFSLPFLPSFVFAHTLSFFFSFSFLQNSFMAWTSSSTFSSCVGAHRSGV